MVFNFHRLKFEKPVNQCQFCFTICESEKDHPLKECTLERRRKNLEEAWELDPKGFEKSASSMLKKKAETAASGVLQAAGSATGAAAGQVVKLVTGGTSLNVTVGKVASKAKRALFQDDPIPAAAFEDLSIKAKLTGKQSTIIASGLRSFKGRDFFEANMQQKREAQRNALEDFYSVEKHLFDSSKKEERNKSQVFRWVTYVKDINDFLGYIKDSRKYDPRKRVFILIGIDGGGTLLKSMCTIQEIYEPHMFSPVHSKPRLSHTWSYAQGIGPKYLDSGDYICIKNHLTILCNFDARKVILK